MNTTDFLDELDTRIREVRQGPDGAPCRGPKTRSGVHSEEKEG